MVDIAAIIAGIQAIHKVGKKVASNPWVREKAQKESDKKTLLGKLARVLGLAKGEEDPPSEPAEWFQRDEEEIVKGIRERLEGMKDEASAQAYLESLKNAVEDVKDAGENAVNEVTRKAARNNASDDLLGGALGKYFDEDVTNAVEELENQLKAPELKALEEKLKAVLEGGGGGNAQGSSSSSHQVHAQTIHGDVTNFGNVTVAGDFTFKSAKK